MKNFNYWLNAITILIILIILLDLNLAEVKSPMHRGLDIQTAIIVCSLVLGALVAWNVYSKKNKR